MVFVHHLLSGENERSFAYNFFAAIVVDYLFDNPVLFKNAEKIFLIDITTQIVTDQLKSNKRDFRVFHNLLGFPMFP